MSWLPAGQAGVNMPRPSQLKNDEIPVLGILRDVSRRGPGPGVASREGVPAAKHANDGLVSGRLPGDLHPDHGPGRGVFRYLITVEVQGQLHTYVHECGSRDRIDPGLRGQWVWLWVTPMSKITRHACVGA